MTTDAQMLPPPARLCICVAGSIIHLVVRLLGFGFGLVINFLERLLQKAFEQSGLERAA